MGVTWVQKRAPLPPLWPSHSGNAQRVPVLKTSEKRLHLGAGGRQGRGNTVGGTSALIGKLPRADFPSL